MSESRITMEIPSGPTPIRGPGAPITISVERVGEHEFQVEAGDDGSLTLIATLIDDVPKPVSIRMSLDPAATKALIHACQEVRGE